MEIEQQYRNVVSKVALQLTVLVLVVFGAGYCINAYKGAPSEAAVISEYKLPIGGTPANTFPEKRFGSDRKFEKYLSGPEFKADDRLIDGQGKINKSNVEIHCVLKSNGQLIGRYRHENGTTLDVNGYIDSDTDELRIRLGHGRELSKWTLSPLKEKSSDNGFEYSGTWGKRNLESTMTLKER